MWYQCLQSWSSFAAGKGSALVIDVGHAMASITPVVDGFVLRKGASAVDRVWPSSFSHLVGLVSSALPKLVQAHARHILSNPTQTRRGIELLPHQLIANKLVRCLPCPNYSFSQYDITQPVEPGAPPRFTLREDRISGTTESWRVWCESREVEEWIQSVAGVLDQGWNDQ